MRPPMPDQLEASARVARTARTPSGPACAKEHRRAAPGTLQATRNRSARFWNHSNERRDARMFIHNKRLQYTVRVGETNPVLGSLMLEQFGGPDGELAAAMRYFTQGLGESDPGRKDMLLDIATEELSHLEVVGNLVSMLNKGARGKMAEGLETADLLAEITGGCDSHTTALIYGGG